MPGTSEVLSAVQDLVRAFRSVGRPIVHVVRLYRPDGRDADRCRRALLAAGTSIAAPHSPGAALAPGLLRDDAIAPDHDLLLTGAPQRVGPAEHVLFKPRWSAFHRTVLEDHLRARRVSTVVVVGCDYPNCPRASLVDAAQRDFRVVAVPDATSGWTATASAELDGIGVAVRPAAEVVALTQPAAV